MSYIFAIIVSVLAVGIDQLTKYIVTANMELGQTVPFLHRVLQFHYIHNDGGAWGMLGGYRWLLLGATGVIMLLLLFLLIRYAKKSKLFFWAGCLVLAGGIGNMIDRVFRGGLVVDFLELEFINFPIFNIADCAVVVGAGLLILYFVLDTLKESKEKTLHDTPPEDAKE